MVDGEPKSGYLPPDFEGLMAIPPRVADEIREKRRGFGVHTELENELVWGLTIGDPVLDALNSLRELPETSANMRSMLLAACGVRGMEILSKIQSATLADQQTSKEREATPT